MMTDSGTTRDVVAGILTTLREGVTGLPAAPSASVRNAVRLDTNECPWSLPDHARQQLADELATIEFNRYPDGCAVELRESLARRFGGSPASYVVGSGAHEALCILYTALARPRPGQERAVVLYPVPSFFIFGTAAIAHGWEPTRVMLDDRWDIDVDATRLALERRQPNVAIYATPNNPTGNRYSTDRLRAVIESAPDTLHLIDEVYAPYTDGDLQHLSAEYEHVGFLGSLSKIGVAAARVGWLRLHPRLAAEVDKVRQQFNVDTFAQRIACLALGPLAPVFADQVARIKEERNRLGDALTQRGIHVYPSEANFLLVRLERDAVQVGDALAAAGVLIRAFGRNARRLRGHARITVGTPDENDALLSALDTLGGRS